MEVSEEKSFNDWIEDGVRISNHLKKPVKLINSREDDTKHGFARPSSKHTMSAVLYGKEIKVGNMSWFLLIL